MCVPDWVPSSDVSCPWSRGSTPQSHPRRACWVLTRSGRTRTPLQKSRAYQNHSCVLWPSPGVRRSGVADTHASSRDQTWTTNTLSHLPILVGRNIWKRPVVTCGYRWLSVVTGLGGYWWFLMVTGGYPWLPVRECLHQVHELLNTMFSNIIS